MNRLLAVCLVSLAVASLAACGGGAPKSQPMPEVQASALPVHADATDDLFEAVTPSAILSEMRAGAEAGAGMKAALSAGADPNARHATHGGTPLHEAGGFSSLFVIVALLEAGAAPGALDESGFTPADYADRNEALKGTDAYYQLLRAYYRLR